MNNITKYILCKSRKLCEDVGIMFIKNGKISEFGTIVSMFMAMSAQGAEPNAVFKYVAFFLPLSSVFCIPEFLMMGKISVFVAIASLMVLIVALIGLAYFVSKVYESMILHRGEPIKLKDMLRLGMNKKKAVKK